MKLTNLLLLSITLFSCDRKTNDSDHRIVTMGVATIEVPADRIIFTVKIVASHNELTNVYSSYRELEKRMITLLEELKIPKKNISFSLLSINQNRWGFQNPGDPVRPIFAEQTVNFVIDSIKLCSTIQTKLIENGFKEINSDITSTKLDDYKKSVLEKAVNEADKKAQILANASKRKISRVIKLTDIDDTEEYFGNVQLDYAAEIVDKKSLTDSEIPMTIPLKAKVKVTYELEE